VEGKTLVEWGASKQNLGGKRNRAPLTVSPGGERNCFFAKLQGKHKKWVEKYWLTDGPLYGFTKEGGSTPGTIWMTEHETKLGFKKSRWGGCQKHWVGRTAVDTIPSGKRKRCKRRGGYR